MTKPRIGIYCPGNGTGGPWRYAHSILAGLDLEEFDVTVFSDLAMYEPRPEVRMAPLSQSIPAHAPAPSIAAPPPQKSKSKLRTFMPPFVKLWTGFGRQTVALARLFRAGNLDLLHTNNTGCEESPVAARWAGIPHVLGTFHVDSTYDLHRVRSGPRHRLLEMLSNRCLDRAIAVSQATKVDWVRRSQIPAGRVITIHNGIDTEKHQRRLDRRTARQRLGLPEDGIIVGGLGRLDEAKGFTYLIDAVASLRNGYPELLLVIAGEGPLRASLEEQAKTKGVAGQVRFLGFQKDVQMVLDALDLFALPSLCEALPYALLEAMATELPCVGTRVGGVAEVIVPDETGFLVRPREIDSLANMLWVLLNNRDLRLRMGQSGRQRVVQHFQESEMVRQTIELYRTFLCNRRKSMM